MVLNSDDVPVNIPSNGTPTVNSILEILDDGFVTDLNVLDLAGTHTYVSDLAVSLYSPDNTRVVLFDGICGSMNNWDLNFDDEAEPGSIPCPPTTGGTYQPQELLSTFNGKSVNGTWTLEIEDQFNLDGGELESWALQICLSDYDCNKTVVNTSGDGPGSLSEVFACAADGDTIFIDNSLAGETFTLTETLVFDRSLTIIGPDGPPCIFDGSVIATAMVFNSATTCLLQNVSIYSGTAPAGGGIDNNGSLTLVDVRVSSPGSPPVQGSVRNTGNMVLEGQCEVNQ